MRTPLWTSLVLCLFSTGIFAQPVASLTPSLTLSEVPAAPDTINLDPSRLHIASNNALVIDTESGKVLFSKNASSPTSIASITKLMTAMVTLDAQLPLDEAITISPEDIDVIKNTHSRLKLGTTLSRREIMRLALMSSENRAAAALGRTYPGGITAFVQAMNRKAASLGMTNTHYVDSTGLSSSNQSTAEDLVRMVHAAVNYDPIREFTTTAEYWVEPAPGQRVLNYKNSNALMRDPNWDIVVSKTGFIQEAGRCLVMIVRMNNRPITIVMLDANGKQARLSDAHRIKHWIETGGQGYENTLASNTSESYGHLARHHSHHVKSKHSVSNNRHYTHHSRTNKAIAKAKSSSKGGHGA
jgi:serine-type D-Ala-D-Ala endopeptidase (penicillin-binding protein 7)